MRRPLVTLTALTMATTLGCAPPPQPPERTALNPSADVDTPTESDGSAPRMLRPERAASIQVCADVHEPGSVGRAEQLLDRIAAVLERASTEGLLDNGVFLEVWTTGSRNENDRALVLGEIPDVERIQLRAGASSCSLIDTGATPASSDERPAEMDDVATSPPVGDDIDGLPAPPPPSLDDVAVAVPAHLCEPVHVPGTSFASGSATLAQPPSAFARAADQLAELNRLGVPARLTIIGHTDSVPSRHPGGNDGLSHDRAHAVLTTSSPPTASIRPTSPQSSITAVFGVAATQPVESGDHPEPLAANRRVEIVFACP